MTVSAASDENDTGTFYRVQGAGTFLEFTGELLGEVTTDIPDNPQPRWLEIQLYRLNGNSEVNYVLHTVGKSVVYHKLDGPCGRGVRRVVTDDDFPDDPMPCLKCRPPEVFDYDTDPPELLVSDDEAFNLELDQHSAFECETAEEVIEILRDSKQPTRPNAHRPHTGFSRPAMRLIDEVKRKDPAIAAAATVVKRL